MAPRARPPCPCSSAPVPSTRRGCGLRREWLRRRGQLTAWQGWRGRGVSVHAAFALPQRAPVAFPLPVGLPARVGQCRQRMRWCHSIAARGGGIIAANCCLVAGGRLESAAAPLATVTQHQHKLGPRLVSVDSHRTVSPSFAPPPPCLPLLLLCPNSMPACVLALPRSLSAGRRTVSHGRTVRSGRRGAKAAVGDAWPSGSGSRRRLGRARRRRPTKAFSASPSRGVRRWARRLVSREN